MTMRCRVLKYMKKMQNSKILVGETLDDEMKAVKMQNQKCMSVKSGLISCRTNNASQCTGN